MMRAKGRLRFLVWALFGTVPTLAAAADTRSYVVGNFGAEIQGYPAFFIKSVEGGNASAPPVVNGQRSDKYPNKEPGTLKYDDARILVSTQIPKGLWEWVNAFASPQGGPPKQVTLSAFDYQLTEKGRRILDNAAISLLEVPGCDGNSRDPSYLTIGLTPGAVHEVAPTASKAPTTGKSDQKPWLPMNFKLTIEGLDTTKVSKIDPITIKRSASGPEYSNLKLEVAETTMASWKQWAAQTFPTGEKGRVDDKMVAAQKTGKTEKVGKLELLSANRLETLLTINFEGLGIVQIVPDKAEAAADSIRRSGVELYVERITISP